MQNIMNDERALTAAQLTITQVNANKYSGLSGNKEKDFQTQIFDLFTDLFEQLQTDTECSFSDDVKIQVAAMLTTAQFQTGKGFVVYNLFKNFYQRLNNYLPEPGGQIYPR